MLFITPYCSCPKDINNHCGIHFQNCSITCPNPTILNPKPNVLGSKPQMAFHIEVVTHGLWFRKKFDILALGMAMSHMGVFIFHYVWAQMTK
jgi:hypothetical protein